MSDRNCTINNYKRDTKREKEKEMATYYNNGNNNNNNINSIQRGADHGLQTLVLMNPTTPYNNPHHHHPTQPQHHHNNNLVLINSRATPHVPNFHHQQQLVGIPLDPRHEISALHHAIMPRVNYSLSLSGSNKVNFGSSRYLKAAQELLDEVVSVGNEAVNKVKVVGEASSVVVAAEEEKEGGERKEGGEMSTNERQEIQVKKAKLVGMLDEVERRYRQYHHQMQIVISLFEQATGTGSAKSYTSLALKTISKQSRCLKDAISSQIRASNKSLGEEDSFMGGKNEGSRLKYVDHQIRQQRALQQLGMIQPNAWRPQRGLPERSVSVLRAWLFEHFLHPYPKDSDKIMLAKQTGLTRSQVSNWFINARVRLWKPMVEEMYIQEIKDKEQNGSDDKTSKSENNTNEDSASKMTTHQDKPPATENKKMNFKSKLDIPTNQNSPPVVSASQSQNRIYTKNRPDFTLIGSPDMESISQASPKKQRNSEYLQSPNSYISHERNSMNFSDERQNRERFTLMGGPANFIGGFGAYPIGENGRFGNEQFSTTYSGNGVSLSLGLPHSENLSLSGAHQSFYQNQNIHMGKRLEIGEPEEFATINSSIPSHSSIAYESINIQNQKRFAAQLLPDFVA